MASLTTIIDNCIQALSGVTPDNLTPIQMDSSLNVLRSVDLDEAISDYRENLPPRPESLQELAAWEHIMHQKGNDLNHHLKMLNTELTRIKTMQGALHIPQLDVLIHAAQDVIRPLYNFSAQLSN
jgi:hypothetical protein